MRSIKQKYILYKNMARKNNCISLLLLLYIEHFRPQFEGKI